MHMQPAWFTKEDPAQTTTEINPEPLITLHFLVFCLLREEVKCTEQPL